MKINCVAIDDEPIALEIIAQHCRQCGEDLSLQCFTSPHAGMEYIKTTRPEIVFLDIELNSNKSGLEFSRELPEGTCLIFTTAYSQYAVEGFNVDAVDFLHKPIFFQRFRQAIDKAMRRMSIESTQPTAENTTGATPTTPSHTITLKVEHKNVVIHTDDVTYIEAMDNYVKVFRRGLPMVLSQITMKEMEQLLPAGKFMRVHRSYIVALDAIDSYSNRKIFLHDVASPIPVGRKYATEFKTVYNKS